MTDTTPSDDDIIEHGHEPAASVPARFNETLPDKLLLLPLSERPFFPAQTMPIVINEEQWGETLNRVGATSHKLVGLVFAAGDRDAVPSIDQFSEVGTVARVHHAVRGDGRIQFIAEGLQRFRITRWISTAPPYVVQAEYPVVPDESPREIRAYALAIINKIKELLPLNPLYKEHLKAFLERFRPEEASPLTDFAAALTSAEGAELQEVLATFPLLRRMEKTLLLVQRELEVTGLQSEIRRRVEERISSGQREFFLKEQLKEIQKELGLAKDDKTLELERLRQRLADLTIPDAARQRIDEEMNKLTFLEIGSPEYAVTRNYLDTLTALPWGKLTQDNFNLAHARGILDRDHDSLDDIKERIIEFLAVGALSGKISGSIILLVGPPGTGKSSIGRSIATALGREFYRFSVGGMRDEAEIKGHRRTYIGAMPGKFMQALRETGSSNPVIMLDEIDKIGASYHGDPAAALLEVLDPEQNADFLDHYLDVRFDLSKVLFICTANQIDSIPRPLLDRMEVIRLAGYITAEKLRIAKHHLWPRQRARAGLKAAQITLSDAALRAVIDDYARESGVRKLEMRLGAIARKAVVRLIDGAVTPIRVKPDNVAEFLGPALYRPHAIARGVGLANGLAWTPLGGATLDIEAALVHRNSRGIRLTGQLGDVMRESVEIALSHVEANLKQYRAPADFFERAFVHVHVPEGATPKDGPSAGITMAVALLSLAQGRPIARPLAMTGELTLTGQVLPVGGIREKTVAARRIGIRELILPEANSTDYSELPDYLRAGLTTHFVSRFEQVVELCFPRAQTRRSRRA